MPAPHRRHIVAIVALSTLLLGADAEPPPLDDGVPEPVEAARALGTAFADLVEEVGPTTVHIQATKSPALSAGLSQVLRDYRLPLPAPDGPAFGRSTGSGVLLGSDGHVLTNHHVVAGGSDIVVTLQDQRRFPATVLGSDPRTDIAVLQIEGADASFPAASLGDSDTVRVGEWVIAIGHPFDFNFTVTAGIVSARGRRNINPAEISDFIQTDAAVNPGSSGGPLFNLDGEVIGINTAIFNPGPQAAHAGISLAIPSNMARRIVDELLQTGRVARGAIGIDCTDRPAGSTNPRPGAELTRVLADSPAQAAGLRPGDVIISLDGAPVVSAESLRSMILTRAIGADTRLQIERGADVMELVVRTRDHRDVAAPEQVMPPDAIEWGGMTLAPWTEPRGARYGVTPPEGADAHVVVLSVAPASPGASAGLAPGDILLELAGNPIRTPEDVLRASAGRRAATVRFWRVDATGVAALAGLERRDLPDPPRGR